MTSEPGVSKGFIYALYQNKANGLPGRRSKLLAG